MSRHNRREFLATVGQGMLIASVGYATAMDLGLARRALADDEPQPLDFGPMEKMVALIQETPPEKILPWAVGLIDQGTSLKQLVAAAALANARTFGGEDYVGFHTLMALGPCLDMAKQLPSDRAALPVLKVLYRNSNRLTEQGGRSEEVLKPVSAELSGGADGAEAIREAVHRQDVAAAESALAALVKRDGVEAYNDLLLTVEEATEVHRVVLAHRAWDMMELVGRDYALSMFRQSLRYCVRNEGASVKWFEEPRTLLPKLLDQYKLVGREAGTRAGDDAWVEEMSRTLFESTPPQAAEAAAAALADGISHESLGQAIAVAANQLVLRDSGRPDKQTQANKPLGSVHGDSIGVHACDSAHAWRGIARISNHRNSVACLILAAYQVAKDRVNRGGDFLNWEPRPYEADLEKIEARDAKSLLTALDGAIREQNQLQACALVHRYGELGHTPSDLLTTLLYFATSDDGALHHEKFYRTTTDEFAALSDKFRWRQLVALARVTASGYGQPAPGYAEACGLLNVKA
jgi:hypothetical protein